MLTLRFVSYNEIEPLSSVGRIRKLLNIAKENKIVILQGKLRRDEEKELIKATMEEINEEFKGIELAVIDESSDEVTGFSKLKHRMINTFLGDRQGLTVIGPASVVKEIKKDPNKIELFTSEQKKRKKKKKKGKKSKV